MTETTKAAVSNTSIGRFEIIECVGVGAFGTVWKARDPELGRVVAVKIPRKEKLAPEDVEQFVREARSAARLKHPGIVSVHEVGRDGERIYIVSDFVEGTTLADYLSASRLTVTESTELCLLVSEALHHAHEQGVIHRDLKPSNIMIDDAGRPHVMDFGLAKSDTAEMTITVEGRILGTPAYMSPEQARGDAHLADARSDVYSLGVVLFELLTGEKPFRGTSQMLLHQVLKDDAPNPRRLNAKIPRDLETICLKCLEKDPERRFHSAELFASELQRFLAGQPIHSRPISGLQRGWRWCVRNPVVATLIALLLMVFAGGFLGVMSQWFRAEAMADSAADARNIAQIEAGNAKAAEVKARAALRSSRDHLYAARMRLAQQLYEDGRIRRATSLLQSLVSEQDREDKRGFEWHYLWRLCHVELMVFDVEKQASDLAFSSDEQWLAASFYGQVKVWRLRDRKLLHSWKLKEGGRCVAFSPDNRFVAAAYNIGNLGQNGTIRIWERDSGVKVRDIDARGVVTAVAFSPDGTAIAAASNDGAAVLWVLGGPLELRGGQLKLWRLSDGQLERTIDLNIEQSDKVNESYKSFVKYWIHDLAFHPDGSSLAAASGSGTVSVWDRNDGRPLRVLTGGGVKVAIGRDGTTLASGRQIWRWREGVSISGASQQGESFIRTAFVENDVGFVVDPTTLAAPTKVRFESSIATVSPNGWRVASGGQDRIAVWDQNGQTPVTIEFADPSRFKEFLPSVIDVTFSPDGRRLAAIVATELPREPNLLVICDVFTGRRLATITTHADGFNARNLGNDPWAWLHGEARFTADGQLISNGSSIWDSRTGEAVEERAFDQTWVTSAGHDDLIASIQIDDDQQMIMVESQDSHQEVFRQPSADRYVRRLVLSPQGDRLATLGANGNRRVLRLWDLAKGSLLATHQMAAEDIAFSRDSQRFAVASEEGVRVFDSNDGKEVATLFGSAATSVCYGPNGQRLLTGFEGVIRVWDVDSLQEVLQFHGASNRITFHPQGHFLAAGGKGVAKIWDLRPLGSVEVAEREALGLARFLARHAIPPGDSAERITDDLTITDEVRALAISLLNADSRNDSTQAEK